jgi:hypothetical protein
MRIARVLAPATLAIVCATPASADYVRSSRYELVERAHTVDVRIDRGHATLVVRRTVENRGPKSDQALFGIDLPEGAVATGLRALGATKTGEHVWFDGELMEAEAAAAKYRELTGIGGYYPKDPALLSWRSQRNLALQVFPVPPQGLKTVEYTLRMPTRYADGMYHVTLPSLSTRALAATIAVRAANAGDEVFVDGAPFDANKPIDAKNPVDLAIAPHDPPELDVSLAVSTFAAKRVLLRTRVAVTPKLSSVPRGAYVVVLVDASRSMSDDDVAAEIAAARAYVAHFSDAKVEVTTFDRTPHRRHGRFVSVVEALADLATLRPARGNGSHLDAALADAESLLATAPAAAPRRIVVMSDLRVRDAVTPDRVKQRSAATGAIVHLARFSAGAPSLRRDDDDAWARAPRATGGVYWRATASTETKHAAAMHALYEEWARPLRIDRVTFVAGANSDLGAPATLAEGEGYDDVRIVAAEPSSLEMKGELWSQPVRAIAAPNAGEGKLWSALVFGSNVLSELTEPEMMVLAMRGRAVSPVTSYLAIEPGVRPSTEGLDWGHGSGSGSGIGVGHGAGRMYMRTVDTFDYAAILRDELSRGLVACGGRDVRLDVTVETTSREIVDVRATATKKDARLERCVEEVGWAFALPSEFDRRTQATWHVKL